MSFKSFYGINLSFTIYSITDNLSEAFQTESISWLESQKTATLWCVFWYGEVKSGKNWFHWRTFSQIKANTELQDTEAMLWCSRIGTKVFGVSSIRCTWEFSTNLLWGPCFKCLDYQKEIQPAKFLSLNEDEILPSEGNRWELNKGWAWFLTWKLSRWYWGWLFRSSKRSLENNFSWFKTNLV